MRSVLPILTPRGFIAFGALLVGPLTGILTGAPLLHTISLSSALLAGYLTFLLLEYRSATSVIHTLRASLLSAPGAFSGRALSCQVKLRFSPSRKSLHLEVRLAPPRDTLIRPEIARIRISPGETTASFPLEIVPHFRGTLTLTEIYLRVQGRLMKLQFARPITLDVPVFPDPDLDREGRVAVKSVNLSGVNAARGGEGREFDHLRSYVHGDDLRNVDWKRSAKRNGLVVRSYRSETHQRIALVLDLSRRLATRSGERLHLDYAADAAAHLSRLAIASGDEVGLLAFHHRLVTNIPTRRGTRQHQLIMEALRGLQPSELDPDYSIVRNWGLSLSRRTLIVFLTSLSMPESFTCVQEALLPLVRKHLPIVLAIRDEALHRMGDCVVRDMREAFIQSAALGELDALYDRVGVLNHSGIRCSYSDILALPQVAAEQYAEVKLVGRL